MVDALAAPAMVVCVEDGYRERDTIKELIEKAPLHATHFTQLRWVEQAMS